MATETPKTDRLKSAGLNPVILMFVIAVAAALLSYILPAGEYRREGKMVVPGTYRVLEKDISLKSVFALPAVPQTPSENVGKAGQPDAAAEPKKAAAVGIAAFFMAVPQGIGKMSALVIMVLFVGGMFGILNRSGAVEAGLQRVLELTNHNVYLLTAVLMLVFSAGTTFLGFSKEYLLMIPLVVALANRMGLSNLTGLAIVALGQQIGHLSSITNPYVLPVAQPMLGLPLFSGIGLRVLTYFLLMGIAVAFMFRHIRRSAAAVPPTTAAAVTHKLAFHHRAMLLILAAGVCFLVYAANYLGWKNVQLSGYYLFLSILMGLFARLGADEAVDAFLSGMRKMIPAAVLIGLAAAAEILLEQGKILDTMVFWLVEAVGTHGAYFSAYSIFVSELLLDIFMPSAVGKVAVSIPILGPMGELTGVSPQTTVFAFLMGNGLSNMLTPTSSALLIYLAAADVSWSRWAKFVWPLMAVFAVVIFLLLTFAVYSGY